MSTNITPERAEIERKIGKACLIEARFGETWTEQEFAEWDDDLGTLMNELALCSSPKSDGEVERLEREFERIKSQAKQDVADLNCGRATPSLWRALWNYVLRHLT